MDKVASGERSVNYQVLARKYRPDRFEDLIGQEPMVRTLRNAFASGRIAHAWMLTGVRGVGKTTTARILARCLNYESENGSEGPTVEFPAQGVHCVAIMDGRHPDVLEIDAASHTGIDDIRDIIESSRYSPVSARFKIYIIDEVHMLSKAAFNGLLKTLEEPPDHVKFIFATTEIRKVPVTILSRCQRFDLRRISAEDLIAHLQKISASENVKVDTAALQLMARAAEGSVRDALSILDQAIAHGGGTVDGDTVRTMLGLADHSGIIEIFEAVMGGRAADALSRSRELIDQGADPNIILSELAAFTHLVTRLKIAPEQAVDAALSEEERTRGEKAASDLSIRALSQAWQILLKGIDEVNLANRPIAASEMVLVRLCHASGLPSPEEAITKLGISGSSAGARPAAESESPNQTSPVAAFSDGVSGGNVATARIVTEPIPPETLDLEEPAAAIGSLDDILALARKNRDAKLRNGLERFVIPISVENGRLEIALTPDADSNFANRLSEALREWTGKRWIVAVATDPGGGQTILAARLAHEAAQKERARNDPVVAQVLEQFPGAEIVSVSDNQTTADQARLDHKTQNKDRPA